MRVRAGARARRTLERRRAARIALVDPRRRDLQLCSPARAVRASRRPAQGAPVDRQRAVRRHPARRRDGQRPAGHRPAHSRLPPDARLGRGRHGGATQRDGTLWRDRRRAR